MVADADEMSTDAMCSTECMAQAGTMGKRLLMDATHPPHPSHPTHPTHP